MLEGYCPTWNFILPFAWLSLCVHLSFALSERKKGREREGGAGSSDGSFYAICDWLTYLEYWDWLELNYGSLFYHFHSYCFVINFLSRTLKLQFIVQNGFQSWVDLALETKELGILFARYLNSQHGFVWCWVSLHYVATLNTSASNLKNWFSVIKLFFDRLGISDSLSK